MAGAGGLLGPCPVFDISYHGDYGPDVLTLPDGSQRNGADCPAGAVLMGGQTLSWASDLNDQGTEDENANGVPHSAHGLGGGWQVCFAQ